MRINHIFEIIKINGKCLGLPMIPLISNQYNPIQTIVRYKFKTYF